MLRPDGLPTMPRLPDLNMLFTRVYSSDHIKGYKDWGLHENSDLANLPYLVPADTRRQWAETGYAPVYQLMSYLPNLQPISTSTDGYVGPRELCLEGFFRRQFPLFHELPAQSHVLALLHVEFCRAAERYPG